MKVKILFISVLFCISISGCKKSISQSFNPEKMFLKILKNEKINPEKMLVLFLAEGMCSECINKEFMNLKEQEKFLDHLLVVGVFSNERIFNSCVNSLKPKMKIFYDVKKLSVEEKLPANPIYFVYDQRQNQISDIFYPQACRISQTLEYYKNIKPAIRIPAN